LDFVRDFKLNLFSDEIVVFTPNGEMRNLPAGATALDFAFEIHSQIGKQCIGAKVNHKLVPLSQPLRNGDQIEIITSKKATAQGGLAHLRGHRQRPSTRSSRPCANRSGNSPWWGAKPCNANCAPGGPRWIPAPT
jgi:(p)ppGpp synthase/HD superfamily hydrolase